MSDEDPFEIAALQRSHRLLQNRDELLQERARLKGLLAQNPEDAGIHFALGYVLGVLGEHGDAIAAFSRATEISPQFADAWAALGEQRLLTGDAKAAEDASIRQFEASIADVRLREAVAALKERRFALAEQLLTECLEKNSRDVNALKLLAEVCINGERQSEAERLLRHCLEIAPEFAAARYRYASTLYVQGKYDAASTQIDILLSHDPKNAQYRNLKAAILGLIGDFENALKWHEALVAEYPNQPAAWIGYGHALKAAAKTDKAICAYRRSIALSPSLGGAYWSLANLKRFRFSDSDVMAMRQQLKDGELPIESRAQLHFALGKAFEDSDAFAESFEHYKEGNDLWRATVVYDARQTTSHLRRIKALFTAEFFAARASLGCESAAPIFIVGMPRSGSTLVEQILASHPAIEATMELPHLIAIADRIDNEIRKNDESGLREALAAIHPQKFREAGEDYLERAQAYRRLQRPHFIDKMPNNFAHIGLIHLMLPNAKIIDVRRHPMACCFSNYKQHFAKGQVFTYRLTELGRYYRDNVDMMAHFDTVLPGRVHRVMYEMLVENPEREIRALLDYCTLPFEETCLRFYENDRVVLTPSSEQVRVPIYRSGLYHWRNFEPWLAPLRTALGTALTSL